MAPTERIIGKLSPMCNDALQPNCKIPVSNTIRKEMSRRVWNDKNDRLPKLKHASISTNAHKNCLSYSVPNVSRLRVSSKPPVWPTSETSYQSKMVE